MVHFVFWDKWLNYLKPQLYMLWTKQYIYYLRILWIVNGSLTCTILMHAAGTSLVMHPNKAIHDQQISSPNNGDSGTTFPPISRPRHGHAPGQQPVGEATNRRRDSANVCAFTAVGRRRGGGRGVGRWTGWRWWWVGTRGGAPFLVILRPSSPTTAPEKRRGDGWGGGGGRRRLGRKLLGTLRLDGPVNNDDRPLLEDPCQTNSVQFFVKFEHI